MKNSKYIVALLCFSLFSCKHIGASTSVEINQTVEEASITNGESRIVTTVDTKNCGGRKSTIEYISWQVVPNKLVDSLRIIEYNKALPKFRQAKNVCKCEKIQEEETYSNSDDIDRLNKIILSL